LSGRVFSSFGRFTTSGSDFGFRRIDDDRFHFFLTETVSGRAEDVKD
jgi:hypothetical protein